MAFLMHLFVSMISESMNDRAIQVFTVLVVFAIGIFLWYSRGNYPLATTEAPQPEVRLPAVAALTPTPTPVPEATPDLDQLQRRESELRQERLDGEKLRLEDLRRNVEALRSLKVQQNEQLSLSYPQQISQRGNEIVRLMSVLDRQKSEEVRLNLSAAAALRDQSSAASTAREQIDEQIRLLEADSQNLRDQLASIQMSPPWNTTEKQDLILTLQTQLNDLRLRINEARAERVGISLQVLQQMRDTESSVQVNREALMTEQENSQDSVDSLRNEILNLESARNRVRMSAVPLESQLIQAEERLSSQDKAVQKLEEKLEEKLEVQ